VAKTIAVGGRRWAFPALCGFGLVVVAVGAAVPALVNGAPPVTGEPAGPGGPSLAPLVTRFVGGTAAALALCALTAWLVGRRYRPQPMSPAADLQLLEALPVGGRCCIHLVRVGDQLLLAGVDATGLKSLLHLPGDADAVADREDGPVVAGRVGEPAASAAA
jgi:flagellar biogenesis protein FliO